MTAKEALLEMVREMSEREAAHAYDLIRFEQERELDDQRWPISDDERAAVERGLADAQAGRWAPLEEVEDELRLR